MGTQLESQYPGKCHECETAFSKGTTIFYQKDPKIACSNEECAKEQGWTKTAFTKGTSSASSRPGQTKMNDQFWNRKELDAVIPEDVKTNLTAKKAYLVMFKTADEIANELYPELKSVDKNTFGQIRSRITSDLIAQSAK